MTNRDSSGVHCVEIYGDDRLCSWETNRDDRTVKDAPKKQLFGLSWRTIDSPFPAMLRFLYSIEKRGWKKSLLVFRMTTN